MQMQMQPEHVLAPQSMCVSHHLHGQDTTRLGTHSLRPHAAGAASRPPHRRDMRAGAGQTSPARAAGPHPGASRSAAARSRRRGAGSRARPPCWTRSSAAGWCSGTAAAAAPAWVKVEVLGHSHQRASRHPWLSRNPQTGARPPALLSMHRRTALSPRPLSKRTQAWSPWRQGQLDCSSACRLLCTAATSRRARVSSAGVAGRAEVGCPRWEGWAPRVGQGARPGGGVQEGRTSGAVKDRKAQPASAPAPSAATKQATRRRRRQRLISRLRRQAWRWAGCAWTRALAELRMRRTRGAPGEQRRCEHRALTRGPHRIPVHEV